MQPGGLDCAGPQLTVAEPFPGADDGLVGAVSVDRQSLVMPASVSTNAMSTPYPSPALLAVGNAPGAPDAPAFAAACNGGRSSASRRNWLGSTSKAVFDVYEAV